MAGRKQIVRVLIALLVGIAMLLTGCGKKTEGITPSVEEISGLSQAAAFIAARVEESGGFISGTDQRKQASDYAYLYDNAVAAVLLASVGAQKHAEIIMDAIVFAQTHDRTFRDGRLRNTYISGDPQSDSGRSIAAGKVTIRVPGFWQNGRWQEDEYTVSTSAGNMAWTILALCATARNADEEKKAEYLGAAMRAAEFVLSLKSENGGFTAGYEGWDEAQTKMTYQSTEHNIDLYCAFSALAKTIAETDPENAAIFRAAADYAKDFVFSMYDHQAHCFYTGTERNGKTVSDSVIPLDTNSLAVLAMGEELKSPDLTLAFVEERMAVDRGYDFSAGDLDGIWNEGTAQMAVCYSLLGNHERYEELMSYLRTQTSADGSIPAADRDGVSTGFVIAGSDSVWEYNNELSIGATSWLAFAQLRRNPFDCAF